ncbi:hypothetical protein [Hyphomicrobium sp. CS1GBMeth3]|uniref:hypothetical protein n=1 Tax=Hyphomicrobium sp. CS1GBMeth3 TaxID=1892845 RepID=UPI000930D7A9|nr:hypothetical protein [Hyphomicrobium sp. CS1GBMeth3]
MRYARRAVWLAGFLMPAAAAAQPQTSPPDLDCTLGFETLRSTAHALPGAELSQGGGFELVKLSLPERWRVQIAFTTPGHPAHPAATLRTFRKQVTGVWTADSKGCGYGDRGQFTILMADMKSGDTELTNASRAEIERAKKGQSILAPTP